MKHVVYCDRDVDNIQELDLERLNGKLLDYDRKLQNVVIEQQKHFSGDRFADAVFNEIDEVPLLEIREGRVTHTLVLTRTYDEEQNGFTSCYSVEERHEKEGLIDVVDYDSGEEKALQSYLHTLMS
ncbi:hypothetical protein IMZ31_23795 (plasmid) [Pontibacillus sp. ALD_SL1]|uniref:hypothetical protein n=1 Tax=Pontibacillus sp. ALD_SL1 TaxID=2777185 RepID=UPI001A96718A|nr:hypothetical protein [Pontibacillus sp. ALD_SL1]QST02476.1 hypothetical protein IMZ31_23795 [Pontibacillus sp. ALD_SL1]